MTEQPDQFPADTPIYDAVARDLGVPEPLPEWVADPHAPVPEEAKPRRAPRQRKRKGATP